MSDCGAVDNSICPCGEFHHPTAIYNPPGQDILAYRVGDYAAFRHALLQSLDGETELSSTQGGVTTQTWRPGGHGDLAVQMMEWWAYLADILTFYNERVATQAYLRTADLPESVNRLVRLLGYRPRPGIGATGTLAALTNGTKPFTLPAGFAIQSKPGPGKQPQVFEVIANTRVGAAPTGPTSPALALGVIGARLPDSTQPPIPNSGVVTLIIAGASSAVKKGDQLLILHEPGSSPPDAFALATATKITPGADPTLGAITRIDVNWKTDVNAVVGLTSLQMYKGGQSTQVWQYPAGDNTVVRDVGSPSLATIDLASIVRGIKSGDPILFQSAPTAFRLFAVKSTSEVVWYANPPGDNPVTAPTPTDDNPNPIPIPIPHTSVTMTTSLATNPRPKLPPAATAAKGSQSAVQASLSVLNESTSHLTTDLFSQKLSLTPQAASVEKAGINLESDQLLIISIVADSSSDTQANRGNFAVLHSWVAVDDLIALPSATIGGANSAASITLEPSAGGAFPSAAAPIPVLIEDSVGAGATGVIDSASALILDAPVPLLIPPLKAFFNLLPVSRGKSVANEVLGSGNAAIPGQDFVLQNTPVTYLQSPDSRSGENYSSTVRVWVNGLEWTEAPSFFDQAADAQVFVTREDDSGKTHVVFGDGEFGARLPTGANNITASYRYGSGADAPDAGTLTVLLKPQPGLRSVRNPVPVGGGSDPDPPAKLRKFAPRSVLTFGRAVSVDDFQVIAAQAPGVIRAAAAFAFDPVEQRPRITVWVGDDDGAVMAARAAIASGADPNRLPAVLPATRIPITLSLTIVTDPKRQADTVLTAVKSALLDPDAGVFGLNVVGIGQSIFDSQIYAACLAVPGVVAVRGLVFSTTRFHFLIFIRRFFGPNGPNACAEHRHDPGAGAYFFLPDDGQSLTLSVEGI